MTRAELARILAQENESKLTSALDVLDNQELEVLSALGQGYSPGQIQAELGFAPQQLQTLRQRLRTKLKLKSEAELLRFAAAQARGEAP